MNGNAVRINVSLPFELVKDLKRYSKPRELSKFLAVAAEEKITKDKREKALKELLAGPPAFLDIRDSAKWVRNLRRRDLKRLKRLGI
ncbi:hypothetical protein A3B42_03630 [Candidatus Daviesbacteria bacterium RIFCSPLOWO2_01_FULL_38_10]|uniref:CopG family transcriptional regulator n=1 Tax=Candidatus Daviesbacteria bacterium GW2011_GWF2_38_6 TaxID=1618432 RepID=A0A0G0KHN4_9BACT|nr:MAG: hypothetical protein US99_C0026G0002 [Candidatus Daviesbacteria bacterium GW2011_GWF2_38_6]OGE26345.1 MAG: hypothetical protein A3D02_01590 [Candidatus Daviesbacteria bacterium RIFCSPHIGHO2_02_FULL_39_41]OGE39505.1 MAG: hypothetical protein A3B42_03630 [Candidatus Daviesbacteria bacterium RIFCSPLOWO2_01_FULL_38_10]OGE45086.1 MAG: hypothetical protein A3E67_03995 [Candidatus Daviesbacteria bacterium RIFCSPHIGHO2_12_FULL_38_25]OGE68579.1 MAG: hypothetical protein A3H81_01955 [Candidatus D